ncbi:NADP-dependent oxidoreductase [Salicibibacter cibarius]|uniref:NADP-dependent oxidoreductase n=2 Tax=Salicibibacter cibarius TaxID=2743000 RepID=A0A7T6Z3W0_9BACI|nr:NADP-dependent oxidoreductase [Salicibibacter cibarius]QQK76545.1 NADP-dependent oxidoreductase [Salicibibacter cibarius]
MNKNRQILLANRPQGLPDQSTFEFTETTVPEPAANQVLVRAHYLSVDPYMRGRMNDAKSYAAPFEVGKPLTGGVVGEIAASNHDDFQPGDYVSGNLDWADYTIAEGENLQKINQDNTPMTTALYVTGMPGLTAYFGLMDICQPKTGETVVVSGAAGAVGMIVGQIAKLHGCRVVGIAGSEAKINYLRTELGFDAAINYKTTNNIREDLKKACPNGIDAYFDNVGGEITDAVLFQLNFHARVALCGQIAHYNAEKVEQGPRILPYLLTRSVLLKGFIVRDYTDRYEEGINDLSKWLKEGKITYEENIIEGLENAPEAFLGLFRGENLGKQLVKVIE